MEARVVMETLPPKILILGKGKVGSATGESLTNEPRYHDPFKGLSVDSFLDFDYIFVCVDTVQSGISDYKDIEGALDGVNSQGYLGVVVIRSTVGPDKVAEWQAKYSFNIVLFPEFLIQRDGFKSEESPWIVVLGGETSSVGKLKEVLIAEGYCLDESKYHLVSALEASLIKLSANAALATKVVMFNSIYKICQKYGVDYESVRYGIGEDSRIGHGHTAVPSPDDGKLGFAGHCLPKDLPVLASIDDYGFFEFIQKTNKKLGR